jgi:hypothetical protein
MSDGTVKAFECRDPDPDGNNPRWGQQVCVWGYGSECQPPKWICGEISYWQRCQ